MSVIINMEFLLNNNKYQISDMEVFVSFLIVNKYFNNSRYDVSFNFLNKYDKELGFEDLIEGSELIKELNMDFINPNFIIEQHINGNFKISYLNISFNNINVGEVIPVMIVFDCLLKLKPAISLDEIKMEVDNFIKIQHSKFKSD